MNAFQYEKEMKKIFNYLQIQLLHHRIGIQSTMLIREYFVKQ